MGFHSITSSRSKFIQYESGERNQKKFLQQSMEDFLAGWQLSFTGGVVVVEPYRKFIGDTIERDKEWDRRSLLIRLT